jgi:hypothetical protein
MSPLLAEVSFESCLPWSGAAILALLIWLLLPSKNYQIAKSWVRESGKGPHHNWLRYRTLKRFLTPAQIVMNAVEQPEFTSEDLNDLNRLFAKLDQEQAEAVCPPPGSRYNHSEAVDLNRLSSASTFYVGELVKPGVRWRKEILKKAEVRACTADRLAVQSLLGANSLPPSILSPIRTYFEERRSLTPDFRLDASMLQGVVQVSLTNSDADKLFQALCDVHPESAFILVSPATDDAFNSDSMAPSGGEIAGMNCTVLEVLHSGLIRKDDPDWRIKALVRITNVPR